MENHLASQLASLGQDVQLRRANLRNLVSALDNAEIRDLAAQLASIHFRTDIVGLVPAELLMIIAESIDGADIFNVLNVSKRWRAVWLQGTVLRLLAAKWFPGLLKYASVQEQLTGGVRDLERLFSNAARKFHFRKLGKFRSALFGEWLRPDRSGLGDHFSFDPTFHPVDQDSKIEYPGQVTAERLFEDDHPAVHYSGGRLAWQPSGLAFPDNSVVFVDDLKTQLRKIYRVPNLLMLGERAVLEALGDQLVVVTAGRSMFAWHLESNDLQQISLPMRPDSCVTSGDMVATRSGADGQLTVWRFGHQVRAVATPRTIATGEDKLMAEMALFCDPRQSQTFYGAAYLETPNKSGRTLGVYKFRMGQHSDTFYFSADEMIQTEPDMAVEFALGCKRAGSFGDFEIASAQMPASAQFQALHYMGSQDSVHVNFNVFESSFSVQRRRGPRSKCCGTYLHLPGPTGDGQEGPTSLVGILSQHTRRPVYSVKAQRSEGREPTHWRRRLVSLEEQRLPAPGMFTMGWIYCEHRFVLLDFEASNPRPVDWHGFVQVFEDDDFIVMAHRRGRMVWSFSTDMVLG